MKEYYQRVSDKLLLEHLESKGAVLIEGAKWCGKTTSAKHIAKSVIEMDRPDMTEQTPENHDKQRGRIRK